MRFVAPGAERLVCLAGMLAGRKLPYMVIRTGAERHLALRLGNATPRLILAAHYDRVEGSLGILDNSCACLQLADFAARFISKGKLCPPMLVIFTDGEENPGRVGGASQGSLRLGRAIRKACDDASGTMGTNAIPALVLDVTGRGDSLLASSTPATELGLRGLADSPLAQSHAALSALAARVAKRAGLVAPLSLPLPWSDDLGLTLGGLGALTISLLPSREAEDYAGGLSPGTWKFLHSPEDSLDKVEEGAFSLMAAFLDALATELLED
jgi:hypothetical protein